MIHKTTRSILSVLLAVLLLVTSIPLTPAFAGEGGAVSLQSESGEGRALAGDGTYLIYTPDDLKEFAAIVNGTAEGINQNTSANAKLMNNIVLNEKIEVDDNGAVTNQEDLREWTPIGNSIGNPYEGTFNGDGHTISGLYIDSSANDQGLFGYLSTDGDNTGTVQNLTVTGSVKGDWYVGGIAGQNNGNVINCAFSGSVSGNNYVGGVVGQSFGGSVTNCYNTGTVSGNSSVGGVVGYNISSVTNCYNTGKVSGNSSVGGVVGNTDGGRVENCYNIGEVSGSDHVGGVVGDNYAPVTNCYFLQQNGVPANGIGGGYTERQTAEPVDNLDVQDQFKGWDFIDTWRISQSLGFPVLQDNAQDGLPPGLGTEASPYEISTATQLKNFATAVNGGEKSAHAKLMNNIDLSSVCSKEKGNWTPIGNSIGNPYEGTFNGQNFKISGLYIYSSTAGYQGLFGRVNGGTVKDLTVSGNVSGGMCVGGVVGYNNTGTVTGCIFSGSGSVSGSDHVGGVVGYNSGSSTVENCTNTGSVNGSADSSIVGGVVGYNSGPVKNCYNTDNISGGISGGVVGQNSGSVTNCYNIGDVSGKISVGGVVGHNAADGNVTGCYFLQTDTVNVNLPDIGKNDGSGSATEKDDTAFHSGEVAWRLQAEQKAAGEEDPIPQVWGQSNLTATTSLPTLVALNPGAAQPVYKVTFKYGYDSAPENEISYTNGSVKFPAFERTGHTLTGWQNDTTTYQAGEEVEITADTEFTAQWTKNTVNYTVSVSADPEAGGTVSGSGEYSEGTQVTVTATANDGYTFVAWQEGGTKIENAGTSYTFTVNDNCTLTAVFEKEPTPTPTPDPTPSGPSTGDSTGWDDILDELENAEKGEQITIDMGDETTVPAEIFESLAGKDVDVTFDLGDIQWSASGADIPTDTDFTDLDLGVNLDTHGIPVNVINTITGEVGTVQITLAHDGEFGFTMTLTAPLGKENAGYWANLYHYDERAEALNFEAAAKIDETGSVTIPFSHASQYAIVIDTHSHATVDVSDIFVDVAPNAWYKDAVQYAYDNGLMTGTSANEFAPEATTTRAMIVSILARLEGVTTAEAAGFADVDDNDWYATAVNWAASVGVVNGYEDNTFRPNTAITREQLAAILMNYAVYKGEDVSNRADLTSYTDQPSTWAQEAMQWAVAEGLISGVTNDQLQPQSSATRAQVAAILQRFLEA